MSVKLPVKVEVLLIYNANSLRFIFFSICELRSIYCRFRYMLSLCLCQLLGTFPRLLGQLSCSKRKYIMCIPLKYRVFIKYCVYFRFFQYSGLWLFSVFLRCQFVYTHQAGRKPRLQQNWREKSQNFKEKTQYLMYMH